MTETPRGLPQTEEERDPDAADRPKVYVCERFTDAGNVCGETFDSSQKLASHVRFQHAKAKDVDDDAPASAPKGTSSSSKPPKTPPASAPLNTEDRVSAYAGGLAFYAGLAAMAPGPVDIHDVGIITAGAKEWARALDGVAERHEIVRQWADLLLAGGVGGPYLALILASAAIAIPILAHHGVLPESLGANAAQLLGGLDERAAAAQAAPPPAAQPAESEQPPAAATPPPPAPAEAPTTFPGPLHVHAVPRMMTGEPPLTVFAPPPIAPNGAAA